MATLTFNGGMLALALAGVWARHRAQEHRP